MSECNNKFLIAYKNYPTKFSDINWLSIGFDSQISLTGFAMDFKLGTATRHFTDLSQASVVNLTKTETNALDIGLNNASIIVTDTSNNSKPFTTAIPVMVKNWVEGDQKLETFNMNVDVKLEGTTQFTIKIDGAVIDPSIIDTRISEHNTSEQAHQFIQQNITIEATARASADTNLQTQINGKQDKIDSTHKLSADLVDDSTTTNKFVTAQDKTNWNNKVDKNNAITSGTHTKITYDSKGLVTGGSDLENSDITTSLGYTPENVSYKRFIISSSSTDMEYPSARAVYNHHDSTKYDASNPSGYITSAVDDSSTTSTTKGWSANKLNGIIGNIEATINTIRGVA